MCRWSISCKRVGVIAAVFGALPGCSEPEDSPPFEPGVFVSKDVEVCSKIATTFIANELSWPPDDYRLTYSRTEGELTLFRATHRSDFEEHKLGMLGGGESRQIGVRCSSKEVVQVLRYQ